METCSTNFQPPRKLRFVHIPLIIVTLCILTACGKGGEAQSNPNVSPPTVSLTRIGVADPAAGIYSGNPALLVPSYSYGAATLGWNDATGQAHTLQMTSSGTPVQVNPTQTTTYTLTVRYQDPSILRPQETSITASATITVKPTESLLPTLQLAPATSTITLGETLNLTPTFTWTGGVITKSVINDGIKDISVSSGTPISVSPSQTTTYTLKLEYLDQRVIPAVAKTAQATAVVTNDAAGSDQHSDLAGEPSDTRGHRRGGQAAGCRTAGGPVGLHGRGRRLWLVSLAVRRTDSPYRHRGCRIPDHAARFS